jgi:hypothetical protein
VEMGVEEVFEKVTLEIAERFGERVEAAA